MRNVGVALDSRYGAAGAPTGFGGGGGCVRKSISFQTVSNVRLTTIVARTIRPRVG